MTGCYLTPMHQKLIDNQPETAENQLELIPAGRWGHPCEMGALTAFLCSSGAGYVNGRGYPRRWAARTPGSLFRKFSQLFRQVLSE